jgi:hypothetical protein
VGAPRRVVSGRQGALKATGLEAPFVGRERELRQLKELFRACADEKKPHLVSVTGIAGIGKSRLAWEFYKYFDGLADTVYWHRGRCLSYGEGVTYWALADIVRMRCLIAEDENSDSALSLYASLEEATDVQDRSVYLGATAAVRRAEGRFEDALRLGVEAAELSGQTFGAATQAAKQGLVEAIEAAIALGSRERAEELLRTVDDVPAGLRSRYLEAHADRFRARLAGAEADADAGFTSALGRFRELELPFWVAVTQLEATESLVSVGRSAEAEAPALEAVELFEELEAGPWVERASRLRESSATAEPSPDVCEGGAARN